METSEKLNETERDRINRIIVAQSASLLELGFPASEVIAMASITYDSLTCHGGTIKVESPGSTNNK